MKRICKPLLCAATIVLSSCAAVPREAAELSSLLGRQIEVLEQSHTATVEAWYCEKENAAMLFLDNIWYRDYLDQLFARQETEAFWNEVIAEQPQQRVESLKALTSMIQSDYAAQRELLLAPLRNSRDQLLAHVRDHFALARDMNATLTDHIAGANAVQERRKRLLGRITDADEFESRLDSLLRKADSLLGRAHTANAAYARIETKQL
ncbi:MAG: hypothetical protein J1D86_04700 [Alistipes sp.]|nr:hypothetical protein [Alistipes sp.]